MVEVTGATVTVDKYEKTRENRGQTGRFPPFSKCDEGMQVVKRERSLFSIGRRLFWASSLLWSEVALRGPLQGGDKLWRSQRAGVRSGEEGIQL
jgi:hypothetical protein